MNRVEVVALLAYAGLRDNRKPDDDVAEAWFEDLGDLPFEDAKAAVRQHFRTTTGEYLMPGHIRAIVRTIRTERIRAAGDISDRIPAHIEALDDPAASNAWMQEAKRRIGNGEPLDDVAPRLQLVQAAPRPKSIEEISADLARDKGAKNQPREAS